MLERAVSELARRFDMAWRMQYRDVRKRAAILVSKLDHCLYDILIRHRAGARSGDGFRQGSTPESGGCNRAEHCGTHRSHKHALEQRKVCQQEEAACQASALLLRTITELPNKCPHADGIPLVLALRVSALTALDTGELECDIPIIVSNHSDLELIAATFGLPFRHLPLDREHGGKEAQVGFIDRKEGCYQGGLTTNTRQLCHRTMLSLSVISECAVVRSVLLGCLLCQMDAAQPPYLTGAGSIGRTRCCAAARAAVVVLSSTLISRQATSRPCLQEAELEELLVEHDVDLVVLARCQGTALCISQGSGAHVATVLL